MIGSGSNTPRVAFSKAISSRSLLVGNLVRLSPTPWICQQCRQHSRKIVEPLAPFISHAQDSHLAQIRRASFSTSLQRSQSEDTSHVLDKPRKDLPSQEEGRRSHLSKRFNHVMDHLQSNIFIAGQRLNDLTGYSGIEALKRDIEEQETLVQTTRESLHCAREAYTKAISQRSGSQREVNELLQRKHAWTSNDLERFTELYRSDHANEQAETVAQENLMSIERRAEEAGTRLSACILARYHEEQIWSDKIRRMSTWGTWGLMGINILLFVVFQIGVEPWRRRRLVKGFEDKVMEALEREGSGTAAKPMDTARTQDGGTVPLLEVEDAPTSGIEVSGPDHNATIQDVGPIPLSAVSESSQAVPLSRIDGIRESFRDMFSERQMTIRRKDMTTAMLEGTAAGVALVGVVVLLLRPR